MNNTALKFDRSEIFCSLASIIFICFTCCIFAPFEIYLSNKGYFFFDGNEMIPFSLLLFLAAVTFLFVCFGLIYLVFKKGATVYSMSIWVVALALYVQGNLIPNDYGIMDGTPIEWNNYIKEGVLSVSVFLFIVFAGIFLFVRMPKQKIKKLITVSSLCIILLQIYTLGILMITNHGLRRPLEYVSTTNEEFELSRNENFIILMLDTFDSQAFDEILKDDNADSYRQILKDFVYYPDTLADYAFTDLAFPAILSGERYVNDETYGEYLDKAYSDSPLLNRLKKDGWYTGIYTTSLFADSDASLKIDNCLKIRRTVSSHRRLAGFMYKLAGFRYVIQPLKQYFWFYPDDMESELSDTGVDGVSTFSFDNFIFYDNIDNISATTDNKMFHWYHLDGTHPPFEITPEFTDNKSNNWEADGIYDEARAMMTLTDKFLNRLKEQGIYDNSTIIIMADHGYLQLRQSPIFMIKPRHHEGTFTVKDDVQLAYTDLQGIFLNILSGETDPEKIIDIQAGDRERIYRYYKWNVDLEYDSYARDLKEYVVHGDCRDLSNVVEDGIVYSHGVK